MVPERGNAQCVEGPLGQSSAHDDRVSMVLVIKIVEGLSCVVYLVSVIHVFPFFLDAILFLFILFIFLLYIRSFPLFYSFSVFQVFLSFCLPVVLLFPYKTTYEATAQHFTIARDALKCDYRRMACRVSADKLEMEHTGLRSETHRNAKASLVASAGASKRVEESDTLSRAFRRTLPCCELFTTPRDIRGILQNSVECLHRRSRQRICKCIAWRMLPKMGTE